MMPMTMTTTSTTTHNGQFMIAQAHLLSANDPKIPQFPLAALYAIVPGSGIRMLFNRVLNGIQFFLVF